ncbi:MAG: insulinase family protein, partial [Oscillospiraceae bacterium]|nr:insulinase family protein [Oscillospiraceae bacterium]
AMVGSLAGELLCGRSSPLYAGLYADGLIHKDFSVTCIGYPGAAFLVAGGESPDPRRVRQAILEEGDRLSQGIDEERFRRTVKHEYGATVRSLNGFDNICVQLSRWWFSGCHYFDFAALYPTLTAAETAAFLGETIREAGSCLSMIQPKGANTL